MYGCDSKNGINAEIAEAERLASARPYSALVILNNRKSELCGNETDSATYELVYSEAARAQGLSLDNDRIMRRCAEVFGRNGDGNRQARAMLQSALCLSDNGEYLESVTKIKESERLGARMGDHDFDSRIYENIGLMNGMAGRDDVMMEYYGMAVAEARTIGNPERTLKLLNRMTAEYLRMGRMDSVMACIGRCMALTDSVEEVTRAGMKANMGCYHMANGDTAKAKECFTEAYPVCPDRKSSLFLGDIYAAEGREQTAADLWYDAVNSSNTYIRKSALQRLIRRAVKRNDKEQALFLSNLLNDTYEKDISTVTATAIADIQARFDNDRTTQGHNMLTLWLCGGIGLLMAGSAFAALRQRRRMKRVGGIINHQRKALGELNSRYAGYMEDYLRVKSELDVMKKQNNRFAETIDEKTREMESIQKQLANYQNDDMSPSHWNIEDTLLNDDSVYRMHRLAATGRNATKDDWDALHRLINLHDRRLTDIFDRQKRLSQNEINIVILTRLRFIPSEIAALTGLSSQNVTNTRARLLGKMFGMKGGAKDFDDMIRNA